MYNLQWLKIEIKIFSNRKIQILLKEQDGDTYFRVWIQLLTIAIECNCNGKLVIGDKHTKLRIGMNTKVLNHPKNIKNKIE